MTVAYKQQAGKWATLRVSYTYAKALDTAGNFFFSTPQDNFNIAAEKGRSDNDQRHRLAVSGTLMSPDGASQHLRDHLWHGWQLSYFYQHASALPFNILTGADTNKDTNTNDRPAGVARNAGVAYPFDSLDVRLERTFRFGDRWRLAAMVDGFNILNHTNFQLPNNVFGTGPYPGVPANPLFGQPTSAADPRQVQLGLKVTF
jgi:hypothetical protein